MKNCNVGGRFWGNRRRVDFSGREYVRVGSRSGLSHHMCHLARVEVLARKWCSVFNGGDGSDDISIVGFPVTPVVIIGATWVWIAGSLGSAECDCWV